MKEEHEAGTGGRGMFVERLKTKTKTSFCPCKTLVFQKNTSFIPRIFLYIKKMLFMLNNSIRIYIFYAASDYFAV